MYIYFNDSKTSGWNRGEDFYDISSADGIVNTWKDFMDVWTDPRILNYAYKDTEYYSDTEQPYVNIKWDTDLDGGIINLMYFDGDHFYAPILDPIPNGLTEYNWYPDSDIEERDDFQIQIEKDSIYYPFNNSSFSLYKKPIVNVYWEDYISSSDGDKQIPDTQNSIVDQATINILDPTVFQVPPPDDDDDPTNDHIVFFGDDIIDIPFPHEILYDHIEKKWYIRMKIYLTNYWYEEEDKPYGPFRWIINEDPKVSWLKINGYESDTNNQYEGVVYKNSGEIEVLLQLRGLMPVNASTTLEIKAECIGRHIGNKDVKFVSRYSTWLDDEGNQIPVLSDNFTIPVSINY